MKTTSVDSVTLMNSVSVDKTNKQGNLEQAGTSFSNIIDGISSMNQSTVINTSKDISPKTDTNTGNTKYTSNAKNTVNTAVKSKLDNNDLNSEETEQVDQQDNSQNVTSEINSSNDKLDSKELVEDVSEKIKNILLDTLNISEEDLEAAMQALGLGYLDCLDKNNLAQLLTQVSGSSDISALITDGTLYQQFNDALTLLEDVKQSILTDLGITEDELMTTLDQLNRSEQSEDISMVVAEETNIQNVTGKEPSSILEVVKETVTANVVSKEQESSVKQEKAIANVEEEIVNESTDQLKAVATNTQEDSEQQNASNKEGFATKQSDSTKQSDTIAQADTISEDNQEYAFVQTKQENVVNGNIEKILPVNEKQSIDAESIVKQIQNQMKVSTNLDTTSMEFQLNPEHLGKLTIQIASKEGTITAQITTQNSAIKEVLESQIVQLRENMNNQGLKVSAVEVTVESHAFERNLEEGNSNGNQGQFEQQGKNSRRQLNYNELDSLEDLSVEEALIAEMMIGNGNSINYTA